MIPKFDSKELEVVAVRPATPMVPSVNIYNYPVTTKVAYNSTLRRKPYWQIVGVENREIGRAHV